MQRVRMNRDIYSAVKALKYTSVLNLALVEFNHLFGLYDLFFSYPRPRLPLNHLGFLCHSTFLLKEFFLKESLLWFYQDLNP